MIDNPDQSCVMVLVKKKKSCGSLRNQVKLKNTKVQFVNIPFAHIGTDGTLWPAGRMNGKTDSGGSEFSGEQNRKRMKSEEPCGWREVMLSEICFLSVPLGLFY